MRPPHSARRARHTLATLLVAAPIAAHAQVQAAFYAPIAANANDDSHLAAPNPNAPFPYGSLVCTTVVGNSSGFSLDFTSTGTQILLAKQCGSGPAAQLVHNFGARFSGALVAPTAGMYTLAFNSDDGNVLTIDGNTISSEWATQAGGPGSIAVMLNAGANPFIFDYYENSYGGANAILQLPPGLPAQPPAGPTTTTPEPATVALLGCGLAGVAVAARRRRA